MLSMFAAIGSLLGGPLTSMFSSVTDVFKSDKIQEAAEFASMTNAQQAEYTAAMQAQADLNHTKISLSSTRMGQVLMLAYGLPPAIYVGMFFITAAIPSLGLHVDPLRGDVGRDLITYAKTIGLSFFAVTSAISFGSQIFASLKPRLSG